MPAPRIHTAQPVPRPRCSVAIEPAHLGINNLTLLWKTEHLTGLSDWVTRTVAGLFPEVRQNNTLILNGLYYAVTPTQSYPSFPAYVDALEAADPVSLRDRLLKAYDSHWCDSCDKDAVKKMDAVSVEALLEDFDIFLDYLMVKFTPDNVNIEIERQAHKYLKDPAAMQKLFVSHFRHMWQKYLADESAKTLPLLRESVQAFQQVDFSNLDNYEAALLVTNQDIENLRPEIEKRDHLILVPSAHLGPYAHLITNGDTAWLLFGARVPKGFKGHAPELNRSEILVRMNALADDTRLRILKLLSSDGELASTEIMERTGLSQSAASRHLKQLSATGYLTESRLHNAKRYKLNPKRIEDTLRAISAYLLP